METAAELVPDATSGNTTSIDIDASTGDVWRALCELQLRELRVSQLLLAVRSLPALVTQRADTLGDQLGGGTSLIDAMTSTRFTVLFERTEEILTLGIIGQFWRLRGGHDAAISDAAGFVAFDQPGYVKSAIDFRLLRHGEPGPTQVITETRNRPTDPEAARQFARYWCVVGPGSKAIRLDLLRALRRRAQG